MYIYEKLCIVRSVNDGAASFLFLALPDFAMFLMFIGLAFSNIQQHSTAFNRVCEQRSNFPCRECLYGSESAHIITRSTTKSNFFFLLLLMDYDVDRQVPLYYTYYNKDYIIIKTDFEKWDFKDKNGSKWPTFKFGEKIEYNGNKGLETDVFQRHLNNYFVCVINRFYILNYTYKCDLQQFSKKMFRSIFIDRRK